MCRTFIEVAGLSFFLSSLESFVSFVLELEAFVSLAFFLGPILRSGRVEGVKGSKGGMVEVVVKVEKSRSGGS